MRAGLSKLCFRDKVERFKFRVTYLISPQYRIILEFNTVKPLAVFDKSHCMCCLLGIWVKAFCLDNLSNAFDITLLYSIRCFLINSFGNPDKSTFAF